MSVRVKICCISSVEEALTALNHGAHALGLVGSMPSGPGVISDEEISKIVAAIPPETNTFLLTSETSIEEIAAHHGKTRTKTIQIVDSLKVGSHADLRSRLPKTDIVQVLHVLGEETIDEAVRISSSVDFILLDSGNPNLATKELGGTGRTHDWRVSRKIVEAVNVPVYLAGGLNAQNVVEAVGAVGPYGVDLCSGVRTDGELDARKLEAFFHALGK
ncbi:MAG: phosphoribosylanthranilate isomerase [Pyrinomonadaceae bacterium]